jgi:hypothetical protein
MRPIDPAALLRQQPQRFGPFWLVKRTEYLIQLHAEALGENSKYRAVIRRLGFFQPDDYCDMFPARGI